MICSYCYDTSALLEETAGLNRVAISSYSRYSFVDIR